MVLFYVVLYEFGNHLPVSPFIHRPYAPAKIRSYSISDPLLKFPPTPIQVVIQFGHLMNRWLAVTGIEHDIHHNSYRSCFSCVVFQHIFPHCSSRGNPIIHDTAATLDWVGAVEPLRVVIEATIFDDVIFATKTEVDQAMTGPC